MKSDKWNFHTTMLINPELLLRCSSPTPGFSLGIPYDTSLLIFCSIRVILGTSKRILKKVVLLLLEDDNDEDATLFAHSKAISVFPVPVL